MLSEFCMIEAKQLKKKYIQLYFYGKKPNILYLPAKEKL